jgi:hypothetical protein
MRVAGSRLAGALCAGQIINDCGSVFRAYRRLVCIDHLVNDLFPSLPGKRGLVQDMVGRMTGETIVVYGICTRSRKQLIAGRDLEIERLQLLKLRGGSSNATQHNAQ